MVFHIRSEIMKESGFKSKNQGVGGELRMKDCIFIIAFYPETQSFVRISDVFLSEPMVLVFFFFLTSFL